MGRVPRRVRKKGAAAIFGAEDQMNQDRSEGLGHVEDSGQGAPLGLWVVDRVRFPGRCPGLLQVAPLGQGS